MYSADCVFAYLMLKQNVFVDCVFAYFLLIQIYCNYLNNESFSLSYAKIRGAKLLRIHTTQESLKMPKTNYCCLSYFQKTTCISCRTVLLSKFNDRYCVEKYFALLNAYCHKKRSVDTNPSQYMSLEYIFIELLKGTHTISKKLG